MTSFVVKAFNWVKAVFIKDVKPFLQDWEAQFATVEGQAAIQQAITLGPQLLNKQISVQDAGKQIVDTLKASAIIATENVAMNAARTIQNSLQGQTK